MLSFVSSFYLLETWCNAHEANVSSFFFEISKFAVTSHFPYIFWNYIFTSGSGGALKMEMFVHLDISRIGSILKD